MQKIFSPSLYNGALKQTFILGWAFVLPALRSTIWKSTSCCYIYEWSYKNSCFLMFYSQFEIYTCLCLLCILSISECFLKAWFLIQVFWENVFFSVARTMPFSHVLRKATLSPGHFNICEGERVSETKPNNTKPCLSFSV